MIGSSVGSASPAIIFCCEVIEHRREVRNVIKQSGILDRYPGVKTGHMPRAPDFDRLIPLAPSRTGDKSVVQLQMSRSALGMSLIIKGHTDNRQWSTKATIGGVILVGSKYFYTTAAHPFQSHLYEKSSLERLAFGHQSNGDTEDDVCSFDGDSDTTFEHDDELSIPNDVTVGEGKAPVSSSSFPLTTKEQGALKQSTRNEHISPAMSRPTKLTPNHGTVLTSNASTKGLSFDYGGEFFLLPYDSPGAEADFALLEVTESHHWTQNVVSIPPNGSSHVAIKSLSQTDNYDAPRTHILAITSRGNIEGQLSGTPFYARTPYDKAFQSMLSATFNGNLERGDCGAWVVNRCTGVLYGHIVAGSPNSGAALIKPFNDVFEHIRYRTGCLPTFPTKEKTPELPLRSIQFGPSDVSPLNSSAITGGNPNPVRQHVKDGDKRKIDMIPSTAGKSSDRRNFSDFYEEGEDVNDKAKAIQSEELIPIGTEPRIFRLQLNTLLRQTPKKLVYPALLYPKSDARRVMAAISLRADQFSSSLSSYALLHSRTSQESAKMSRRFCNLLFSLSRTPLGWENSGLLDEALRRIPLGRIYDDAENEFNTLRAIAMSIEASSPDWGYQDCVVRALMRWFKRDYFTWVNSPACDFCLHPTMSKGIDKPTPEENIFGALRVELYQCTNQNCTRFTRFPRYTDPWVLLDTCRGRVGEWVNVFSLFCCAVGARTRWVWSAEGHLWVEVYSEHAARWLHVDVLEGAWDSPNLYSECWGKELSYCIAFSTEGAVDVTRRYVRNEKFLRPRNKCSELTLFYMLKKITMERRDKLSKEDQQRLLLEDAAEQEELQTFRVLSIVKELVISLAPSSEAGPSQQRPKLQESRNIPRKLALEEKWLEDTRKVRRSIRIFII
ncbi:hypothetical protein RRF57_012081 [Xylaria bambusicola]|uniref:Rad4/PNGase transglutaminase-like fold domain-containing protein n=1 Tax=Xylaria bambusicola TaxID=326684 RepID=A0AAN7UXJ6_9PEZI